MVPPAALWQARKAALGPYACLGRVGAKDHEIAEAASRLSVTFPEDVIAIMKECSGFGLPGMALNLSFSPACTLHPIHLWFTYEDLGEIFGDPFDEGQRIVIGENPFGADYGYLVRIRRICSTPHLRVIISGNLRPDIKWPSCIINIILYSDHVTLIRSSFE